MEPVIFRLESSADVSQVALMKAEALRCVAASGDVVVDCSSVWRIDGAAIQIFLALSRALEGSGRTLGFRALDPKLASLLEVVGVTRYLRALPAAVPSVGGT